MCLRWPEGRVPTAPSNTLGAAFQRNRNSERSSTRKILFEHENKNGMLEGYTDNYLRIQNKFDEAFVNKIVEVEIDDNNLLGN